MLPLNPLLQLTPLRTQRGVARLAEIIWHDPRALRVEATATRPDHLPLAAAKKLPRRAVRDGTACGRLYDQRWCRVALPAGGPRWLHWDEQGEATLFIDGVPFFGFDVAHRHCELPAGTREVWVESLCVQAAIWHPDAKGLNPDGNLFRGARLLSRLHKLQQTNKTMGDVRGLGAMIACEFVNPVTGAPDADLTKQIQQAALKKGLLLLTCGVHGNVLRFLFPLTIEDSVFDEALAILDDVIGA